MNALAKIPQSRKTTLDVNIPLHGHTDSEHDVAELVSRLLSEISEFDNQLSHADILQGLAITTALRGAMADAASQPGVDFSLRLLDVEVGSYYEVATDAS